MKLLKQIETLFRAGTSGGLGDAQLLERFVQGRDEAAESAFAALVDRHGAMVLRVCRQVLGDDHDAEDAAQATFLVLARRARSIGRRASVASWLHGVALLVAAKARVAAARRRKHEERGGMMRTGSHVVEHDWESIDDPERWAKLHEELARLPDAFRQPLVLCYLEGLTQEQAASTLRCPLGTLQSRLARGRARLKARLPGKDIQLSATIPGLGLLTTQHAPAPPAWAEATVQLALRFAHQNGTRIASAGTVSAALAEEVLRAMVWTKIQAAAGVLLSVALLLSAAAAWRMEQREASPSATTNRPQPRPVQSDPQPVAANEIARTVVAKRVRGIVLDDHGLPVARAWVGRFVLRVSPEPIIVNADDMDVQGGFGNHDAILPPRWAMMPFRESSGAADRTGEDGRFDVSIPTLSPRQSIELHVASSDFRRQALRPVWASDAHESLEISLQPAPFVRALLKETPNDHPKEPFDWAVYALDAPGAAQNHVDAIGANGALWACGSWWYIEANGAYDPLRRLGVNLQAGRYRAHLRSKTLDRLIDISVPPGDQPIDLPDIKLQAQADVARVRAPAGNDDREGRDRDLPAAAAKIAGFEQITQFQPARWMMPTVIHGKVVGRGGQPIKGARISSRPAVREAETTTDATGEFNITVEHLALIGFSLLVDADGMASNEFHCYGSLSQVPPQAVLSGTLLRPPCELTRPLVLTAGATVIGRVVRDGKPVAGIRIELHSAGRQERRDDGDPFTGDGKPVERVLRTLRRTLATPLLDEDVRTTRTDEKGVFRFTHVLAETSFRARGEIGTIGDDVFLTPRDFRTGSPGAKVDLGDLNVEPGRALAGRLVLPGGKAPNGPIHLMVTTPGASGELVYVVDDSGRFAFTGIPSGPVSITIFYVNRRFARYQLSAKNKCRNPRTAKELEGRLDHDITDLTILLERGIEPRLDIPIHPLPEVEAAFKAARAGPITGVPPRDYPPR
jgi:RNA polymerase sigma factor (sigma-70 family)